MSFSRLPPVKNEPMKSYAPGSEERSKLEEALTELRSQSIKVPVVVDGEEIFTKEVGRQAVCAAHNQTACHYHMADAALMTKAIRGAVKAKEAWEAMPFSDRAAIFLKAADLLSTKHRYRVMAATMLGQGKNAWQAEIDAAAELCDFWRFNCAFAERLQQEQPTEHAVGSWNRLDYRPLEGFVLAVSPFNFTAIGGNLPSAPALMGNVVVWKPSDSAILSNYLIYEILREAGLPPGVIQFVPGPAPELTKAAIEDPEFAGLHFTGSTQVFTLLWQEIAANLPRYRAFPRIVGESGGKNMHFLHPSASVPDAVSNTIRAAFEYQGQKCSACSRLYVPDSLWSEVESGLISAIKNLSFGSDFASFCGPVINQAAFDKITGYIGEAVKIPGNRIIVGGKSDARTGYFVEPTIILTEDADSLTMREEIFGPVLTVFVYNAAEWEAWARKAAETSAYALTAGFFARDRDAIVRGSYLLRNAAGNLYINDKCTGAVVGAQPFGGARRSGTNDKAGSYLNLLRWVSPRNVKENFLPLGDYRYPSNF